MITFYDIASSRVGAWSPNTWKTRVILNYKRLPYTTVWLEYPEIEPRLKEIGAKPTDKKADGRDHYTVPVIVDGDTIVEDTARIAEYLESKYPEPTLWPEGTRAIQNVAYDTFLREAISPLRSIQLSAVFFNVLNEGSIAYFRQSREAEIGKKMEDLAPPGEAREAMWKESQKGWDRLAEYLGDQDGWLGSKRCHADLRIVSWLITWKVILPRKEWERTIATFGKGKWVKFLDNYRDCTENVS